MAADLPVCPTRFPNGSCRPTSPSASNTSSTSAIPNVAGSSGTTAPTPSSPSAPRPKDRARFDHFLTEASHWEGQPKPKPVALDAATDTDRAELGRFQFTPRGRLVFLEVAIDGRRYQDLLRLWGQRECWDWGEK